MAKAKKTTFTAADVFYLDSHINNDAAELAEAVGTDVGIVEEYVNSRKPGLAQDVDRLFAKKERNGEVVATISTEGASSAADANRKSTRGVANPSIIYHPKARK